MGTLKYLVVSTDLMYSMALIDYLCAIQVMIKSCKTLTYAVKQVKVYTWMEWAAQFAITMLD